MNPNYKTFSAAPAQGLAPTIAPAPAEVRVPAQERVRVPTLAKFVADGAYIHRPPSSPHSSSSRLPPTAPTILRLRPLRSLCPRLGHSCSAVRQTVPGDFEFEFAGFTGAAAPSCAPALRRPARLPQSDKTKRRRPGRRP